MGERSSKRRQEDGRVRVLRILRERKARPSRFPCRRQQMANCSPLASSRRSIERLMLNPTFRQTLPDTSVASEKQLRYVAHFTFAHDTLMWLVGTFNLIHKLAVSFWQFSCDDICPSWHAQAKGRTKKHSLADLELIRRHSAPRSKLRLPHPPS